MLNSTATRIIFDQNKRAVGVEFIHNGQLNRVSVGKEVVVSGGFSIKIIFLMTAITFQFIKVSNN